MATFGSRVRVSAQTGSFEVCWISGKIIFKVLGNVNVLPSYTKCPDIHFFFFFNFLFFILISVSCSLSPMPVQRGSNWLLKFECYRKLFPSRWKSASDGWICFPNTHLRVLVRSFFWPHVVYGCEFSSLPDYKVYSGFFFFITYRIQHFSLGLLKGNEIVGGRGSDLTDSNFCNDENGKIGPVKP